MFLRTTGSAYTLALLLLLGALFIALVLCVTRLALFVLQGNVAVGGVRSARVLTLAYLHLTLNLALNLAHCRHGIVPLHILPLLFIV